MGRAQVTLDTGQVITVDITGRHYATDATLCVDHAFIRLSISDAHRLGEAIIAAAAAAFEQEDHRQTRLWSDTTTPFGWRLA